MNRLLATIKGQEIYQNGIDNSISFVSGLCVDADGSPRAYGPNDSGLDLTIEAGHPGNWWGILTDSHGNPIIQGASDPHPGFYISSTSYQNRQFPVNDPRRYLDAEQVPFVVIPGIVARQCAGVALGCLVVVTNIKTGDRENGVCGDTGPSSSMGEAAMKMVSMLGYNNSPRDGGCSDQIFRYTFYPGQAAPGYELQRLDGSVVSPNQVATTATPPPATGLVITPEFGPSQTV